jgi:hypothetical protein
VVRFRGSDFSVPLRREFTVTSPTPGQVFGFQDDLRLEWTPADASNVMRIWLTLSCASLTGGTRGGSRFLQVLDNGALNYDLGLLPEATDPAVDTSQDCTLNLRFMREAERRIAPPFAPGSRIDSSQTRVINDLIVTF